MIDRQNSNIYTKFSDCQHYSEIGLILIAKQTFIPLNHIGKMKGLF